MTARSLLLLRSGLLLAALLTGPRVLAVPITVDFEGFADGQLLTTQIAGLTFSNTVILVAGNSLNEVDFPPRSGTRVASGFGSGPITIDFATPLASFAGYFTYNGAVSIQAFDATSTLLGSVTSAFSTNYASDAIAASSPNELLALAGVGAISRVSISNATSMVMDDLTATPSTDVIAVPEPNTLALLLAGCFAFALRRRRA